MWLVQLCLWCIFTHFVQIYKWLCSPRPKYLQLFGVIDGFIFLFQAFLPFFLWLLFLRRKQSLLSIQTIRTKFPIELKIVFGLFFILKLFPYEQPLYFSPSLIILMLLNDDGPIGPHQTAECAWSAWCGPNPFQASVYCCCSLSYLLWFGARSDILSYCIEY